MKQWDVPPAGKINPANCTVASICHVRDNERSVLIRSHRSVRSVEMIWPRRVQVTFLRHGSGCSRYYVYTELLIHVKPSVGNSERPNRRFPEYFLALKIFRIVLIYLILSHGTVHLRRIAHGATAGASVSGQVSPSVQLFWLR